MVLLSRGSGRVGRRRTIFRKRGRRKAAPFLFLGEVMNDRKPSRPGSSSGSPRSGKPRTPGSRPASRGAARPGESSRGADGRSGRRSDNSASRSTSSRSSDTRRSERSAESRPSRDGVRPRSTGASQNRRSADSTRDSGARPSSRDGERRTSARPSSRDGERRTSARPRSNDERSPRLRSPRDDREKRPIGKPRERGGSERTQFDASAFVEVASDIDIKILPKQVLAELRNISPAAADFTAKHLAAAMYALEDDDAERAYQHAIAARARASRLASVREMCGLAAYHSGMWAEALNEFRTYQRLTGDPHFMPLMADCERGLGRPQKALALARSEQVRSLDAETRIEMRIVTSGARRDLGQLDAAIATLECPELTGKSAGSTRLRYAYAEALLAAGRRSEARDWFVKTTLGDSEDLTDAADRALEIDV